MLIGALLVIACGLLVAGFVTGITAYAVAALVLSVAGGALYVVALRRIGPEAGDATGDADAADDADEVDDDAATSSATAAAAPVKDVRTKGKDKKRSPSKVSTTTKGDTQRSGRSAPAKRDEPAAGKANASKPTSTKPTKPASAKPAEKPVEAAPVAKAAPAAAVATGRDRAPEKAPQTKAPETKAPETKAPETKAPETAKAPEKKAPATTPADKQPTVASTAPAAASAPAAPAAPVTAPQAVEKTEATSGAGAPGGSDIVLVVPGRMRYHVEGCKLLDGRADAEALTVDDAKDEGFSACSRCANTKVLTTQA